MRDYTEKSPKLQAAPENTRAGRCNLTAEELAENRRLLAERRARSRAAHRAALAEIAPQNRRSRAANRYEAKARAELLEESKLVKHPAHDRGLVTQMVTSAHIARAPSILTNWLRQHPQTRRIVLDVIAESGLEYLTAHVVDEIGGAA